MTVYENCVGACKLRLAVPNTHAATLGHTIFGDTEVRVDLLDHEKVHARQQDRDVLFLPKNLWDLRDGVSSYEQEARCSAAGDC